MFILILVSISKNRRHITKQTNSKISYKTYKDSFIVALSLAVVFGLGWGFGLLATSYPSEAVTLTFQVLFSIFVGTQGVLLFLLHGVRNSNARGVWKGWATSISNTAGLTSSNSSTKTPESMNASRTYSTATLKHTLSDQGSVSEKKHSAPIKEPIEESNFNDVEEEIKVDLSGAAFKEDVIVDDVGDLHQDTTETVYITDTTTAED